MWHVYILQCANDVLYVGVTRNLNRRTQEHQDGIGGYFTGYSRPMRVVYSEGHKDSQTAYKREAQIKRWSRTKKQALVSGNFVELQKLSISRD